MRHVERSAIVPFPAEAMFDLVADFESYPQFLPGCAGARVLAREPGAVIGRLSLAQGPIRLDVTTRNELQRPERIGMQLQDGPFRALNGAWTFKPLGSEGCRVGLQMHFGFDSRVTDLLLGPVFEAICNQLIGAFVQRAHAVLGPAVVQPG